MIVKPLEVLRQPLDAGRVAIEGGHCVACLHQLGGLAARGGAKVEDAGAGWDVEQTGGDRSGSVLHPETTLGKAGQLVDGTVAIDDAHGVGQDWRGALQAWVA